MPPKGAPLGIANIFISSDQLCDICTDLDIKNFFIQTAYGKAARDVLHRASVQQLDASAKKGRLLCLVLKKPLTPNMPTCKQDAEA
jgi:hypothetical protein